MRLQLIFLFYVALSLSSVATHEFSFSVDAKQQADQANLVHLSRKRRSLKDTYIFDEDLKAAVLKAHNDARRTVSPRAADMLEMTWDDELAQLATNYAKKCVFAHNPDRKHSRFSSVGENIFISTGSPFDDDYPEWAVGSWNNEKSHYDFQSNTCTPGKICGHYTQVVWASSLKVGCGASLCSAVYVSGRIFRDTTLLFCDYGPAGNFRGEKPYSPGAPCSACEDPSDTCKNNLCSNRNRGVQPEAAHWLEWGKWGPCSKSCGGDGQRRRTRICSTYVLDDCEGYSIQVDPYCASKPCPAATTETPAPVWGNWRTWSRCTKECGGGLSVRSRECKSGLCSGCEKERKPCNTQMCLDLAEPDMNFLSKLEEDEDEDNIY